MLLALVTLVVALGAGVGGWLYGRRLAKPVISLGAAAAQIGRGDFTASIPIAGPREVAALGRTMDDMRRDLLELVDALRRREEETRIARRARDAVLGNISHEFRTPLAAQLASIELLRDGLEGLPPAAQRELLTNVERGVRRLMHLIDNLLESVRIESGQLSIRHQSVDLREVVRDATEWMAPLLEQRGLGLTIELADDAGAVVGDAQRLVQVMVNLLSNAAKFAPAKTMIRIGGEPRDRLFALWVEDEGPGFPGGDAAPLFERFRRGAGDEPDAPGLGLGLAIVKSIVERHAGHIVAERTAEGRTRFTLTLPLEEDA
jgi:signal transduction histidine kinase